MKLEQLERFLTVAKFMSFTKAADYLYIGQSTISKDIANLEQDIGVQLFIRNNRAIELTEGGKLLVREGNRILEEIDDLASMVRKAESQAAGKLMVESIPFNFPHFFSLYKAYCKAYTNDKLLFKHQPFGTISESVALEKADLGITFSFELEDSAFQFESFSLAREHFYVVAAYHHPIAKQKEVCLADLNNERLLFFDDYGVKHARKMDMQAGMHFIPQNICKDISQESVLLQVKAGYGIVLLPAPIARSVGPDFVLIQVTDPVTLFDDVLIWKKENQNPALKRFLELLHNTNSETTPLSDTTP